MPRDAKAIAAEIKQVWDSADASGRDLTADERMHVAELLTAARQQKAIDDQLREFDMPGLGSPLGNDPNYSHAGGGIGDQFVQSKGWQAIADPGTRPQKWSTGAVEIGGGFLTKGTLLEGAGAPGAGTGGGLNPVPTVVPGVVTTLFQPLGVSDLFAQGTTDTSTVRYINEGTATNAAAAVAEAAAKPESTFGLSTVDEPVKKIATSLTVSDEMLEDGVSVQSYLNTRLVLFVRMQEETSLLRGGGTNDLVGMFSRSINTYPRGTVDNNAIAIAKAIGGTRGSSFLDPTAIIMHPDNYLATRLLTDTAGQFFGGGPFGTSYGNAGQATMFTQPIWGLPVVLSTTVGKGTALLGSFKQGAEIVRRSGPTVEITNSHSDYFVKNLAMIRSESRLALCVFRPTSFTQITGLS